MRPRTPEYFPLRRLLSLFETGPHHSTLYLIIFIALTCQAVLVGNNDTIWKTDEPDFQPSLEYPIYYTSTLTTIGYVAINQIDKEETGYLSPSIGNFYDGLRKGPRYDDDASKWNYVGHPLWGSETYLRARSQGYSAKSAFAFSLTSSMLWEFGMESFSQRPSSQDLIITPIAGSLIGELRYRAKRNLILKEGDWRYLSLLVILDPLQSFCEWVGKVVFRKDWTEPAFQYSQLISSVSTATILEKKSSKLKVSFDPYTGSSNPLRLVYQQRF